MTLASTKKESLREDQALRRYRNVLSLIASPRNPTPLVRLNKVAEGLSSELYLKLEWFNPFGSIKDRTALYLIRGMQDRGELDGKELVEPTSGNTGIALAAIAALLGRKLKVTIPDGVPEEKKLLLRMLGAEVWATPDDLCPIDHPKDGAIALAHSFVKTEPERYAMPNQYANPDNVAAHYETTGPEIWKYLKEKDPGDRGIAIEPQTGHRLPGLKNLQEAKTPEILDPKVIDEVVRVDDKPAYAMTKRLFREDGLIVGPSTGAIVHAAVEYGRKHEGLAVGISPDSGFKYATFFSEILGNEGTPGSE